MHDERALADILENIPGAVDARAVRSLLAAWWEYAGVTAASGEVVDSSRFLAARAAAGRLELPPTVAERVIAREFALLHAGRPAVRLAADAVPARAGAAAAPRAPARAGRERAERLQVVVAAGMVVYGSLVVGLAMLGGVLAPHLPLPGAGDESLVAPWRAWLAILAGATGAVLAAAYAARRRDRTASVRWPGTALAGLLVAGLGLLAGSVVLTGVGGLVFLAAGAAAGLTGGRGRPVEAAEGARHLASRR